MTEGAKALVLQDNAAAIVYIVFKKETVYGTKAERIRSKEEVTVRYK